MVFPYIPATTNPAEGNEFDDLLGDAIADIVGLNRDKLVRPRWQIDAPISPGPEIDWCGHGIVNVTPDNDSFLLTDGTDGVLTRNETCEWAISMYGPTSGRNCALLRDGLQVPANREVLRASGVAVQSEGSIVRAPELVDDRWYDRHDLTLTLVREIRRSYRILSFVSASGIIHGHGPDPTIDSTFSVTQ
jgi:hypothetical protein